MKNNLTKLTKFQLEVWKKIESIIKKYDYKVDVNFDDDFVVTFKNELGEVTITIHPNNDILYVLHRNKGGVESEFYGAKRLEFLINKLNENDN